jgi:hypothetical protein
MLQWKLDGSEAHGVRFRDLDGNEVTVSLREEAGRLLGSVRLAGKETTFVAAHREGSSFLHADIHLSGDREFHYLMPGGKDDLVSLLNDELMSGGKHKVYLKSVANVVDAL